MSPCSSTTKEDGYAGRPLSHSHIIDVRTQGGASPSGSARLLLAKPFPGGLLLAHAESYVGSEINILQLTGDRFSSPTLTAFHCPPRASSFSRGKPASRGAGKRWIHWAPICGDVFYRKGKLWTAQAISAAES